MGDDIHYVPCQGLQILRPDLGLSAWPDPGFETLQDGAGPSQDGAAQDHPAVKDVPGQDFFDFGRWRLDVGQLDGRPDRRDGSPSCRGIEWWDQVGAEGDRELGLGHRPGPSRDVDESAVGDDRGVGEEPHQGAGQPELLQPLGGTETRLPAQWLRTLGQEGGSGLELELQPPMQPGVAHSGNS